MSSLCRVLLIVAIALPGCFFEPSRPGAASDANRDGNGSSDAPKDGSPDTTPVAHKIADAYYSPQGVSNGMTQSGYSVAIPTIPDGDLVLFFANVDNGSNTVWMLPPGFHQLHQIRFGNDGQTFVAGWKIASGETSPYAEAYGSGIVSGNAVITIIDVTGADATTPIETSAYTLGTDNQQSPAMLGTNGVATTRADTLLVFAGGVDWDQPDPLANATFTEPPGFTVLDELSDSGGVTFDWTTLMVSSMEVAVAGPAVAKTATVASSPVRPGTPWTVEIAIAPAAQ